MDGIGGGFFERMKKYYLDKDYASLEKQILKSRTLPCKQLGI